MTADIAKFLSIDAKSVDGGHGMPTYSTPGAAAMDLRAVEPCTLRHGEITVVSTGLRIAIPDGYCGLVIPRSGLAAKCGVTVVNAPGLIDPDYRGEIKVIMTTLSMEPVELCARDRIAQLLIVEFIRAALNLVTELPESTRGEGGLGSTGR